VATTAGSRALARAVSVSSAARTIFDLRRLRVAGYTVTRLTWNQQKTNPSRSPPTSECSWIPQRCREKKKPTR